jgi:AcrR family transcriptional regulator
LTRQRVLEAAIDLADRAGLPALSMRRLGKDLGVEAMSLYNHVADKDDLLDGMADLIAARFEVPSSAGEWTSEMRGSQRSAHAVLLQHPWAGSLLESRVNLGPERLRYVDGMIGVLSAAGFTMPTVGQAFTALDSHLYGFTLQEQSWAFDIKDAPATAAALAEAVPVESFPNLAAMIDAYVDAPDRFPLQFDFGLDLILDGLKRLLPEGAR